MNISIYNINANFNVHHGIKEKFGRCTDIPQICVFVYWGLGIANVTVFPPRLKSMQKFIFSTKRVIQRC